MFQRGAYKLLSWLHHVACCFIIFFFQRKSFLIFLSFSLQQNRQAVAVPQSTFLEDESFQNPQPQCQPITNNHSATDVAQAAAGPGKQTTGSSLRRTRPVTVDGWGYDWLQYESRDGVVTKVWCSVCRHHQVDQQVQPAISPGQKQICDLDAYTVGTSNIKKDTAKAHSTSKCHLAAVRAKNPEKKESLMHQQITALTTKTMNKMCKLFDIAYTVAYCEQPFTLYRGLVSLERKHGVELGTTYCNDMACRAFIGHIAGTMMSDLQGLFNTDNFYCSILFDGSSDKSQSEKEVISIKFIEDGVPKIKLLG